jgi:hypothetical protein
MGSKEWNIILKIYHQYSSNLILTRQEDIVTISTKVFTCYFSLLIILYAYLSFFEMFAGTHYDVET